MLCICPDVPKLPVVKTVPVKVVTPTKLELPVTFNASGVWSVPIPRLLSVNLSPLESDVDLNVIPSPVDTISTVSFTEAPTANTTVEPLVAVKSPLARRIPFRYTSNSCLLL